MPVEFLTDDEAAAYGRYAGVPSQADPERVPVDRRRGPHMKPGFALQRVTIRWAGSPARLRATYNRYNGVMQTIADLATGRLCYRILNPRLGGRQRC
jgi:hypothetical protein